MSQKRKLYHVKITTRSGWTFDNVLHESQLPRIREKTFVEGGYAHYSARLI